MMAVGSRRASPGGHLAGLAAGDGVGEVGGAVASIARSPAGDMCCRRGVFTRAASY
jgi:hypothetical protein